MKPKRKQAPLMLSLEGHKKLKIYCAENGLIMKAFVEKLIDEIVKKK